MHFLRGECRGANGLGGENGQLKVRFQDFLRGECSFSPLKGEWRGENGSEGRMNFYSPLGGENGRFFRIHSPLDPIFPGFLRLSQAFSPRL